MAIFILSIRGDVVMRICSGFLLFSILLGCDYLSGNKIEIDNTLPVAIDDVVAVVGGDVVDVGRIGAGESASVSFKPKSDLTLEIKYVVSDSKAVCHGDVYITTGFNQKFSVEILEGGKCSVEVVEE
jgi:hypothetical protein